MIVLDAGVSHTLPTGSGIQSWNPTGTFDPLLSQGFTVTKYSTSPSGIQLTGAGRLVYTYIGKEAGSTNRFKSSTNSNIFITADHDDSSGTFSATAAATATTAETWEIVQDSAGYLDFSFQGLATCCNLNPGTFTNGVGPSYAGLSLAVALFNNNKTAYLMFGDGFGDHDFDDMVVKVEVSPVPVPAAFWLFGTALIGFVGMSRRTKNS